MFLYKIFPSKNNFINSKKTLGNLAKICRKIKPGPKGKIPTNGIAVPITTQIRDVQQFEVVCVTMALADDVALRTVEHF